MSTNATTETQTQHNELVELVTLTGVRYRKGQPAPTGTVTSLGGDDVPVTVEDWGEIGDWITLSLSGGYEIGIPEAQIERILLRVITGTA